MTFHNKFWGYTPSTTSAHHATGSIMQASGYSLSQPSILQAARYSHSHPVQAANIPHPTDRNGHSYLSPAASVYPWPSTNYTHQAGTFTYPSAPVTVQANGGTFTYPSAPVSVQANGGTLSYPSPPVRVQANGGTLPYPSAPVSVQANGGTLSYPSAPVTVQANGGTFTYPSAPVSVQANGGTLSYPSPPVRVQANGGTLPYPSAPVSVQANGGTLSYPSAPVRVQANGGTLSYPSAPVTVQANGGTLSYPYHYASSPMQTSDRVPRVSSLYTAMAQPAHNPGTAATSCLVNAGHSSSQNENGCTNCRITVTTCWRKDHQGKRVCNACGLFLKQNGETRPEELHNMYIQRRRRKSKVKTVGQRSQEPEDRGQVPNGGSDETPPRSNPVMGSDPQTANTPIRDLPLDPKLADWVLQNMEGKKWPKVAYGEADLMAQHHGPHPYPRSPSYFSPT